VSVAATKRALSPRAIGALVVVVVLIALALDTTTRSDTAPRVTGRVMFDPAAYGEKNFDAKVVPEISKRAVAITELVPAIEDDADAAGEKFGARQGSSPYNFAVKGEGVAGEPRGGLLPLTVKGLKDTKVNVQIGPAINGTALRDAVGFINFNQFVNQVDYADAATALNTQVKTKVLKGLDAATLDGKTVSFVGAFSLLTPSIVTITPVSLEVT
jgi:predicted lipoprotein